MTHTVTLTGEHGCRHLTAQGAVPEALKPAVAALRWDRNDSHEEDLDEVTLELTLNEDGTVAVKETSLVKVVRWEKVERTDTLRVVSETEHQWV
jgi:hypothetical protein